jgi:hypothetical protein
MKKVLFITTVITVFAVFNSFKSANIEVVYTFKNVSILETEYQKGWKDGHCEGWKDVKGKYAYCPYAPYAPYPEYPKSPNSYRDGYNDGFKRGMSDARK